MIIRMGIDPSLPAIYEGMGNGFRSFLPIDPVISEAILDPRLPMGAVSQMPYRCVFREDNFDLTARVRRGRFYELSNEQQPSDQTVFRRVSGDLTDGSFRRPIYTYNSYQFAPDARVPKLVALGSANSLWLVASPPERISTGELLFILKARHSFGVLPEIGHSRVPERGRAKVVETLETLADAAHREAPGSIIDRARDAAQYCLATWATASTGQLLLNVDLGPLLKKVPRHAKETACAAAEVVRLLHARNKPNVQERFGARPPMEDDAELAIKAVACIVRDLGWALA